MGIFWLLNTMNLIDRIKNKTKVVLAKFKEEASKFQEQLKEVSEWK